MSLSTTERRRNKLDFYDLTEETTDELIFEEKYSSENVIESKHTEKAEPPLDLQEYVNSNLILQEHVEPRLNFNDFSSRPEIIAFEDLDCESGYRDISYSHCAENYPDLSRRSYLSGSDQSGRRATSFDDIKENNYDSSLPKYISTSASSDFASSPPEGNNKSMHEESLSLIFKQRVVPTDELNVKRLSSGNTFTTAASTLSLNEQAQIDSSLHLCERSNSPTPPNSDIEAVTFVSPSDKEVATTSSKVQFGTISIRGYDRTLGDNPSCSSGPSLSIGWTFISEVDQMSVDKYEAIRCDCRVKHRADLVISRAERDTILKDLGYSRAEMAAAVRLNVKIKSQRRRTVNNLQYSMLEEKSEGVLRKFKRLFKTFRKRGKK